MYHDCCRPFHIGKANPETAEKLMRSRYSAIEARINLDSIVGGSFAALVDSELGGSK